MRVLIIGVGALGTTIAQALHTDMTLTLYDIDTERAASVAAPLGAATTEDPEAVVGNVDIVVEAAGANAVSQWVPMALEAGCDVVMLSVGALVDAQLRNALLTSAARGGGRILVPSGAVGGLDALNAARQSGLAHVTLTTRKPPAALATSAEGGARVVFDGSAAEAVVAFPKNENVAAAIALAGLGFEKTRVRVIADPAVTENTHTLEADGDFGRFTMTLANKPSPGNPASSRLAALAAIAVVRKTAAHLRVGT